MPTVRFCVTGHVHGVGFRAFVQMAASLGELSGSVWNCQDGSVQGIVTGDQVVDFIESLSKGPGRIDKVTQEPASDQVFEAFTIGATR